MTHPYDIRMTSVWLPYDTSVWHPYDTSVWHVRM